MTRGTTVLLDHLFAYPRLPACHSSGSTLYLLLTGGKPDEEGDKHTQPGPLDHRPPGLTAHLALDGAQPPSTEPQCREQIDHPSRYPHDEPP